MSSLMYFREQLKRLQSKNLTICIRDNQGNSTNWIDLTGGAIKGLVLFLRELQRGE